MVGQLQAVLRCVGLIVLGLGIVGIALNYIPVKLGLESDQVVDGQFVCALNLKTGFSGNNADYCWDILSYTEDGVPATLIVRLNGEDPFRYLSNGDFRMAETFSKTDMRFVFTGTLSNIRSDGYIRLADINVTQWDVLRPIERLSFRADFSPKSYLTLYDFNWAECLRSMFL